MHTEQTKRKLNQKGFSLVEMAVTLAIIGIMAAVSFPMFTGGPAKRLKASARNLWADIRYTRMEAVKRRTNIGIQFFPVGVPTPAGFTNNTYVIFLDDGFVTSGAINPNLVGNGLLDAEEGLGAAGSPNAPLKTIPMLRDVALFSTSYGTNHSIGFNSRALPNGANNGNIELQSIPAPNRHYRLVLSQAGSARIESNENSENGGGTWSEN